MPTLTQAFTALAIGKSGKRGQAASVAGLDRTDFLLALARHGEDSFHVSLDVPAREIADG